MPRGCSSRRPTGATEPTACSSASAWPPASAARTCSRTPSGTTASSIANQGFEWVADGISPELDNESMQEMCYQEVGLTRFEAVALRNEIFTGNVRDFPEGERGIFEPQSIRSIATVPINVDGRWWGFIGFDDCVTERVWSAAELDALRTAASLVAAAIVRERAEAVLREHEQKLRAVFDTALDAIFITDDDRRYVDVNPAGCDLIGVSKRDLIGRHLDEFLPPERLGHVKELWAEYIKGGPVQRGMADDAPGRHRRRLGGIGAPELRARPPHRLHARHHRPEAPRDGAAERSEAREPRPARRRRRPRLQQPPDRDHRLCVAPARARRRRHGARARPGRDQARRRPRRRADEAAARLRAPSGVEAAPARPEHRPRRGRRAPPAAARRPRRARAPPRAGARDRPGRPGPDRAGDRQPRRQRQRRDAARRPAVDRHPERRRRLRRARRLRHGHRHGRADALADLRAVLHDPRPGRRPRARVRLRDRPPERRRGDRREHARRRLRVHRPASADPRTGCAGRGRRPCLQHCPAPRRSSSSRTRTSCAS